MHISWTLTIHPSLERWGLCLWTLEEVGPSSLLWAGVMAGLGTDRSKVSVPFLALECWGVMLQAHMCARTRGLHEQALM